MDDRMQRQPEADGSDEEENLYDDDVLEVVEQDGDVPMDEDDFEDGEEGDISQPVFDVVDTSSSRFTSHSKAVFTVSPHPFLPLVASGGEDDLAYLWDPVSGVEVAKLTGHEDSVISVGWSKDGEMVATGGMDGKVRVWRRHEQAGGRDQWAFLTSLEGPEEVVVRSPALGLCRRQD